MPHRVPTTMLERARAGPTIGAAALARRIEVPNYKSKAELLHYLRIAITMERTGFGID